MNPVSSAQISQSIEAINTVMKEATTEKIELAEKMVRMENELKLGKEPGKGDTIDLSA